jgi:hypothetical protein
MNYFIIPDFLEFIIHSIDIWLYARMNPKLVSLSQKWRVNIKAIKESENPDSGRTFVYSGNINILSVVPQ